MTDIFIVGAPRSGTTWVQAVLSRHPALVTAPETHLFSALAATENWYQWAPLAPGLNTVLTRDQYDDWRRALWTTVREQLLAAKPTADRVLEKTPSHALVIETIRRLVPGARIIHLVRDPRDVAQSLLGLEPGVWGRRQAPRRVEEAAAMWLQHVRAALAGAQPEDTMLVRYEDLLADDATWDRLLAFCDLPTGPGSGWELPDTTRSPADLSAGHTVHVTDAGTEQVQLATAKGHSFHSREAPIRTLTPFEARYVERACASEMRTLRYDPSGPWRPDDQVRATSRRVVELAGRGARRVRRG